MCMIFVSGHMCHGECVCMCTMLVCGHVCHDECVCICMMFVCGHMCHGAYVEDGGQLCAFGFFLLDSG